MQIEIIYVEWSCNSEVEFIFKEKQDTAWDDNDCATSGAGKEYLIPWMSKECFHGNITIINIKISIANFFKF